MRWRLPPSAGAHSNPAADLVLWRQRVRVEPEVGMRFRTLGSSGRADPNTRKRKRPRPVGREFDDFNGLASLLVVARRAPIPLPTREPRTTKPCSRCGRDLPLEAFNRESRARDGRRGDCRECEHETARAIYTRARARSAA
jgi:hypothetical protein